MPTLQHSPSEIVRKLIIDLSLGVVGQYASGVYTGAPWPVFDSGMPDKPDEAIAITDTTGRSFGYNMHDGMSFGYPGFQVMVRANDHSVGWRKADAVSRALQQVVNRRVNVAVPTPVKDYDVAAVPDVGDVLPLGDEPNTERQLFSINCTLDVEMV